MGSLIAINKISAAYGGIKALEEVSFSVQKGEYVALLGPNGSGKSTLIKLILGLIKPDQGTIEVFGKNPFQLSFSERKRIGYVPQYQEIDSKFPLSVFDVILMGRYANLGFFKRPGLDDKNAVEKALAHMGITDLKNRPIAWLSGGQRQRMLIARALASEPELLILDEPTTSLDIPTTEGLYHLIDNLRKTLGLTVLVVSHDVGVIANEVDTIACLAGRLVAHGRPSDALTEETMECMYGRQGAVFGHGHLPHLMVSHHDKKNKEKNNRKSS